MAAWLGLATAGRVVLLPHERPRSADADDEDLLYSFRVSFHDAPFFLQFFQGAPFLFQIPP